MGLFAVWNVSWRDYRFLAQNKLISAFQLAHQRDQGSWTGHRMKSSLGSLIWACFWKISRNGFSLSYGVLRFTLFIFVISSLSVCVSDKDDKGNDERTQYSKVNQWTQSKNGRRHLTGWSYSECLMDTSSFPSKYALRLQFWHHAPRISSVLPEK